MAIINRQSAIESSREALRGILLPFTTPFATTEEIDLAGLRKNIRAWNETGIKGYVALGSTGERVNLDEREYVLVVESAREEVPANLTLIVGAGQQSTRGTIVEIKRAAVAGADAVLVLTPHFYRAAITQDALSTHFMVVADSSPLPVLLYSMPALTGIKIEPETVARLSEHPNILGIKDSSADVEGLRRTLEMVSKEFAVLTGNGTVLCEALQAGALGGILAVGCVAPRLSLEIFRAIKSGENEAAAELQRTLTPLASAVTTLYGIGGLKAAMDLLGYSGGAVRAPLKASDEPARKEIARLLRAARLM
ncbi:MAG TPA: dihydrodipicolinate synthase family protein [Pyrinomonadaceae bacterium]|nr:dihydrodipicolinate synthase family protein [Pyrinomonadaceae bacterium]